MLEFLEQFNDYAVGRVPAFSVARSEKHGWGGWGQGVERQIILLHLVGEMVLW